MIYILLIILFAPAYCFAESTCYGTTQNGRIENAEKLPLNGKNFTAYSDVAWNLGRTFVHTQVKAILLESYEVLYERLPSKVFVYGETGFENGGLFEPHKTHQNGLSVDLMVPIVIKKTGKSVPLPTNSSNKWGYDIEFDKKGNYKEFVIDFDTLGEQIMEIYYSSLDRKVKIWRVIFDPQMVPLLHASKRGPEIKKLITIPMKNSWVRHDEHIHVDFAIPCEPFDK